MWKIVYENDVGPRRELTAPEWERVKILAKQLLGEEE